MNMKSRKIIHEIRHFFERHGFGFFQRLADRLGMRAKNVRIYFIYVTFFTVGLSFGFYLTFVFAMKLKNLIYTKRSSVFDL